MKNEKNIQSPACASCELASPKRICFAENGTGSKNCPTLMRKEILLQANKEYDAASIHEFALQASRQEAECYANRHERPYVLQPTKTRIMEICEFAKKIGYRRLGLAFCIGLTKEAQMVEEI